MEYEIVKLGKLVFHGFVRKYSLADKGYLVTIPGFWDEVMDDGKFAFLLKHMDDMGPVGICYGYQGMDNTFKYMIGVRNQTESLPGCEKAVFPDGTFALFKAVGKLPETLQKTIRKAHEEGVLGAEYEHAEGPEIEIYPEGDSCREDYVSLYAIPIRKKA